MNPFKGDVRKMRLTTELTGNQYSASLRRVASDNPEVRHSLLEHTTGRMG